MRTQRIFWFLICFIPNVLFANPATAAHASIVEAALAKHKATLTSNIAASKAAAAADDSSKGGTQGTAAVTTNEKLLALAQTYAAAVESCTAKTTIARTMCLEESAPAIAQFMSKYGILMQGATTAVSGISGTCESVGKIMNSANIMMGVYQAACATAQGVCESSCLAADKALESYASAVKAATGVAPTATSAHMKVIASTSTDKAQISGVCATFAANATQAIPGAILALQAYKTAQNCEDQNSTNATGIDCNNPQNAAYNQKGCMCTRNELPAAECQNQIQSLSQVKAPTLQVGGKVILDSNGTPAPPAISASEKTTLGSDAPAAASQMPGAPMGGSGGGAVGASGGGNGKAQDGFAGNGGRRMNTNIIGGFGGGAGAGFGSGSGYGEDASLKAYSPGGSKDPSRTVASQVAKEVTAQAGRSNWEKVKSRYIDNTGKLLGN